MLVAVTKKMNDAINKRVKQMGYTSVIESMTPNEFSIKVGNVFMHDEDYDMTTGTMKVIKIVYPDSYYAWPRYLTTKELRSIYRNSNGTFKLPTMLKHRGF
jgi:hypothetical protein